MPKKININIVIALLSSLAISYAFFEQWRGFEPCHLCWIERIIYFIIIVYSLLFFKSKNNYIKLFLSILLLLEIIVCFYHIGVEQHLWSSSCSVSFNQPKSVFNLPSVTGPLCDDVIWKLWGLSMATYNLFFASILTLISFSNFKKNH